MAVSIPTRESGDERSLGKEAIFIKDDLPSFFAKISLYKHNVKKRLHNETQKTPNRDIDT